MVDTADAPGAETALEPHALRERERAPDAPARDVPAPTTGSRPLVPDAPRSAPEPPERAPGPNPERQAELVEAAFAGRLRELIDPPDSFSFSAFATFEHCPLAYALKYICGLQPPEPVPAFAFGSAAHRAFELFTRARREAAEQGNEPPGRQDLDGFFAEAWESADFGSGEVKAASWSRVGRMLDAFWSAESQRRSTTIGEETVFRLPLALPDGAVVSLSGIIDRLDRLPDGSIELLDYKTGDAWGSMAAVFNLQLAIYALGCVEGLELEAPRRALLYFVEHGLFAVQHVSGESLAATRREVAVRAAAIRDSDFAATPGEKTCRWCDYRALCESRQTASIGQGGSVEVREPPAEGGRAEA